MTSQSTKFFSTFVLTCILYTEFYLLRFFKGLISPTIVLVRITYKNFLRKPGYQRSKKNKQ